MTKITIQFTNRQDSIDFFRQFGMEGAAKALEEAERDDQQRRAVAVGKRACITTTGMQGVVESIELDEEEQAIVTLRTDDGQTHQALLWNTRAEIGDDTPTQP